MEQKMLRKYAEMAVKTGINIQPNQTLVIRCPIHGAEFARECALVAYEAGAKEAVVFYSDEQFSRIRMDKTSKEVLCDIKEYQKIQMLNYINTDGGAAFLSIGGSDPEIYKGLDMEKIDEAAKAASKAQEDYRDYTMNSRVQWCVVAIPSEAWATKVFPDLDTDAAVEKLWQTIFKVSRLEGDPAQNWKEYTDKQMARREKLNSLNLKTVHLTSANGTDLYVGLAEDCVWGGGKDITTGGRPYTVAGTPFIANMPTEEIFTAPHKDRVDGIVYGTKPYVYNGSLIDEFVMTFKDGKVVDYDAKVGKDLLKSLLETDEGASRIGEVALVSSSSPINKENILFYNTLFDENAACHIAFGEGYPGTVVGGEKMSEEQLLAKGVNQSVIHEDVMIGSADMKITGICENGETVTLFENGEWVF